MVAASREIEPVLPPFDAKTWPMRPLLPCSWDIVFYIRYLSRSKIWELRECPFR